MGLFGSFFGGKKKSDTVVQAPASKVEMKVSDAASWISSEYGKYIEEEKKKFSHVSSDISESVSRLKKLVGDVMKVKFEGDDKTYAAVNMIKDTWAKKASVSISSYERELSSMSMDDIDFASFRNHFHRTLKLMEETGMIPKQRIVMGKFFKKESSRLADILNSMGTKLDEMREIINGKSVLRNLSTVEGMLRSVSDIENEIAELNIRKDAIATDIESAESKEKTARKKLREVTKSGEWKKMEDIENEEEEWKNALSRTENEIIGKLGDVKRVVKIFSHDCENVAKSDRKIAEKFSDSPMKAFLNGDPGEIQAMFKEILLKQKSGHFSVSEKDSPKMKSLRGIVDSKWLAVKRAEYDNAKDMISDCRKRLGEIALHDDKRDAERTIERTKKETEGLQKDVLSLKSKISAKEKESSLKKSEIADYIKMEMDRDVVFT